MRRSLLVTVVLLIALLSFLRWGPADRALRVGSGFTAHVLCSLAFHSDMDPQWAYDDYIVPVIGSVIRLTSFEVDREKRTVSTRSLWTGADAIWRDGAGCVLVGESDAATLRAQPVARVQPAESPAPWPDARSALSAEAQREIDLVLDAAFDEPLGPGSQRQTLAVVAAYRGELISERYAPGVDAATPLLSWSMAKSITATLIGIGIEEGRFTLEGAAPVPEWRGKEDARGVLSIDHLLRMSTGLEWDEFYGAVNDVSTMLFASDDTGAAAAAKPLAHAPDTLWAYSSGSSNILARILRDAFSGDVSAMLAWSRTKLFDPIGMTSAVLELDASGTFIGSSFAFATARDWMRFGQLHLQDGIWNGERVLPAGWSEYVSTPTPAAPRGRYGAHWWLNAGSPGNPEDRDWPGVPTDAYAARGMSGQYVVVVPSKDVVIVRLGLAQAGGDEAHGIEALISGTLAALER